MKPSGAVALQAFADAKSSPLEAIEATSLTKTFSAFQAVKVINLDIRSNKIYRLLGANRTGKTTPMKILCGLLLNTIGPVALAGITKN